MTKILNSQNPIAYKNDIIREQAERIEKLERALRKYPDYARAWCDAMSETSMTQAKRGSENVRSLEAEFDAALSNRV